MNRLSDQGRGYTCDSMRSTARRWRRRIGTMWTSRSSSWISSGTRAATIRSLSAGPGSLFEVRLGVGLAEVHGLELPRLDELLPDRPGVGQLDERSGRGVRLADRAELDARRLAQHVRVAQCTV